MERHASEQTWPTAPRRVGSLDPVARRSDRTNRGRDDGTGSAELPAALDRANVPTHVACVMDGNGRWAKQRGLPRTDGHAAGEVAIVDAVEGALALGVRYLTLFAFSTENWRRPADEVKFLMNFNENLLLTRRAEFAAKGVQMAFSGRRDWRVPRRVLKRMEETERMDVGEVQLTLTLAFNYGGRAELTDAVRRIVDDGVPASKVDERLIARYLYHPEIPDPDLVVRTSGEQRISNFLLWEAAYAEYVFPEVLWPDFRRGDLYDAVVEFQQRQRRYGGL